MKERKRDGRQTVVITFVGLCYCINQRRNLRRDRYAIENRTTIMSAITVHETRNQFLKVGDELLDPAVPREQARIANVLAGRWKVHDLHYAGQSEATAALIGRLTPVQQARVLTRIDAVGSLSSNKQAADTLVGIVTALPQPLQTKVLSMRYIVANLAEQGHAAQLTNVIAALPVVDQSKVLSAASAADSLTKHGQGEAVQRMQGVIAATLPPATKPASRKRRAAAPEPAR